MKLLSVTNRYYFFSITIFFFLAGILLFYSIKYQLNDELNEQLKNEQSQLTQSIRKLDTLDVTSIFNYNNLSFKKADSETTFNPILFDTLLYDNFEKEYIPFRLIRFSATTKYQNYIFTIQSSKIENEDIILSVFFSLMLVFALFSFMLFISNYYFSKRLWSPFLKTITTIKTLNIGNADDSLAFAKSSIQEFSELNSSLQQMIERIKSDYRRMKDFSENASHELQTPLSIIRSKLESLLQSKDLKANDAKLINQALESTVRLSRINQTLLLLTKIENRQFENTHSISFFLIFEKYIALYSDLLDEKDLSVSFTHAEDFLHKIHPSLADILVSNLLSNAIKHNIRSGRIDILLYNNGFEIKNSGEPPEFSPESLFTRFKKGTSSSEHLGLGLALVKEIAETNNLQVEYNYIEGMHILVITNLNTEKVIS